MKKTFLAAALWLIMVANVCAQEAVAGADVIKLFLTTHTCIVLDDNIFNGYNNEIKAAVEKSWTITPYEFISVSEFEKRKFNDNYSFLLRTKDTYKADTDKMNYTFLSLLQGGKYGSVYNMPTLCSFPLAYYKSDDEKFIDHLGAIVRFVQNHVNLTKEHPELSEKNIIQYYNKNVTSIGNKTLYLVEEDLAKDVNTVAEIKAVYSKPFKIVEAEEVEKLVKNIDKNAAFLHKVGPVAGSPKAARCFNIVMGTDGSIYYIDFHKISAKQPDGFLKTDFKSLNKQ